MNLSVKRIALLFSVASAALTSACNDPKEIGLPQGQTLGVFVTDSIPITTSSVLVDSVPTSGSSYLLAGKYNHPKLGTIKATSFFQPIYSTDEPPTFEAGATVDSLVLILPYDYATGNTAADQKVDVHLLADSIQRRPYFSYESLPYGSEVVGSATFKPVLDSSAARRVVRIRLAQSLAERLLSYSGQSFNDYIKNFYGLALVPAGADDGAVVAYRSGSSTTANAYLGLYYSAGGTAKSYVYPVYSSGEPSYISPKTYVFNQIQADPATPLAGGLTKQYDSVASTAENPETYVQGGLGIMTRIRFDNFDEIRRQGSVAINRAELVVTALPGSTQSAQSKLILYDATGSGKILRSPSAYWPLFIGGGINGALPIATYTGGKYTFDITSYINQILLGRYSNDGLFLSLPSTYTDLQIRNNQSPTVTPNISLEESVVGISIGGHNHPTAPVKLKIYYTPIRAN